MKSNLIDKILGFFNPRAELRRIQTRAAITLVSDQSRRYDAAAGFSTTDWLGAGSTSANMETRGALKTIRARSRDLIRNNAYARRAVTAIVNNAIGSGIQAHINGKNEKQSLQLQTLWREWSETPALCDAQAMLPFNGMQRLAFTTMVESGECLSREVIQNKSVTRQLLEPDYIDESKTLENNLDQGIEFDPKTGKVIAIHLHESHPGDYHGNFNSQRVEAKDVARLYSPDRCEQRRGVPWLAPAVQILKDLAEYQFAELTRMKLAACTTAFITEAPGDSALPAAMIAAQRSADWALEPGTVRHLKPGQQVQHVSPQAPDDSSFVKTHLQAVASAMGITYELLTNDFSNVNFSSGRMGWIEFNRNLETWRWQIFIPQFCDPAFKSFIKWASLKGVDVSGASVEWIPPRREMIDPAGEISAMNSAVRNGFSTWSKSVRELGFEPDQVLAELKSDLKKFDDAGVVLDCDPRKLTQQGMLQMSTPQNGANSSAAKPQDPAKQIEQKAQPEQKPEEPKQLPPAPEKKETAAPEKKESKKQENDEGPATLNGAQVTALLAVVEQVVSGALPYETAVAICLASFGLDQAAVDKILGPAKNFEAKPQPKPEMSF